MSESGQENITSALRVSEELSASDFFSAEWERAQAARLTRYWSGDAAPPARHAEARLVWSSEALLVRFICRQEEPLVVSDAPETREKTLGLWERDVCEIFVAPDTSEPEHYFEFEAAPTGEWIDLEIRCRGAERETAWDYRSNMTAAARVEEGRILIGMRVPWEAFGRRPQAGEVWRANLFRCVGSGASRGYLAWQPTRTPRPNFHVPEAFGWLRFD
ncbi:MAG TPA: carbohydrate-binding family 9-like protein [Pyrinomonadaceae bacterium]|nr:carbohydrate-binding family 9-like protein [Pyrinomonadaceae bacterium]